MKPIFSRGFFFGVPFRRLPGGKGAGGENGLGRSMGRGGMENRPDGFLNILFVHMLCDKIEEILFKKLSSQ